MDLFKANIFRAGIFKQAKYLVSTPQVSQKVLFLSESGVIEEDYLPIKTGFVYSDEKKMAWLVLHALKLPMLRDGVITEDEEVLLLSERSYIPLDPNKIMKQKTKESLTSLENIAEMQYEQELMDTSKNPDPASHISLTIINLSFIMLGIYAVVAMVKGCG